MISFLLTLKRMVQAMISASKDKEFQVLFFFTFITFLSGTIFYSQVEGLRIIDALYFSVVTLTTVGYGDFTPQTDFGKMFTIIYTLAGIGIIVGFINKIASNTKAPKAIRKSMGKRKPAEHSDKNDQNHQD
ncbi:potassium channel family protein [Salisediminibacterium beveridgei]|uniref:Potassium channel protein n=1 Tax=Salisediminibacterium beveridgei TaxID=632773 RepID=A0A1D7QQZ1_9BACI|nr:potassium channel family protein [Salisediminibacterium beveridgei]AOM81439.1 Potassium channel protein [Salisediminibacterium beveridgei]